MSDHEIADRLSRLERRNRWLTGGLAALVATTLAGIGFAHATSPPLAGDLTVRSITVVDAAGVPRVRIAAPAPHRS